MTIELTLFAKHGGPLTKRISLNGDGSVRSDSSECSMSRGTAGRLRITDLGELAAKIETLHPHQALGMGRLRPDLADRVEITTKAKLNGATRSDLIARTGDNLVYHPDEPAPVLFDFDSKGMPAEIAERIARRGGFEPVLLVAVLADLGCAGRLFRASTSAGIYNCANGERLPGSGGMHGYCIARDGSDAERFLQALHARCWLAGFGWLALGTAGQLLERSIIDRMVYAPERLVFEAPPVLVPPLAQEAAARHPIVTDGGMLDTRSCCPPLTLAETAKLDELRAREAHRLQGEVAKARGHFVAAQAERLARRTGCGLTAARHAVERQCHGVLLPSVELQFDDPELGGKTVAEVLAEPERYEGETLADPLEGVGYGRGKAKVMRRADGSVWIYSFAHGRTVYDLRFDAAAVEEAIVKAPVAEAARVFVRRALIADLDAAEIERLRNLACERSGIGRRVLDGMLKAAGGEHARQRAKEERERRAAERRDARPQLPAPAPDAEFLPVVNAITDIWSACTAPEPPMREPDGYAVQIWSRRVSRLHTLNPLGDTALPPPELPLITRLDEPALAELIERHVEFVVETEDGTRAVHLNPAFVRHLRRRPGDRLPVVAAVATLPIVLDDGTILAGNGLARAYDTVFRIPRELLPLLPRREDCAADTIAAALEFLLGEWLVDVSADFSGKCIIIACALTIIERVLLGERPAFFVSAGRRGGGKTTVLNMIALAVLGLRAPAAAWSPNEEERRKALFSYLLEGVPFLVWDNIALGTAVSCPHIEKSLTAETYADRVLGASRSAAPLATTVQAFTGNNIAPRGDLASRSLRVTLPVTRPDPENRDFRHQDPFGWTLANRGKLLAALYTILLGNPRRGADPELRDPAPTRFKAWWELIGSALEHAAETVGEGISFKELLIASEADDEQATGLAAVIATLLNRWPNAESFDGAAVAAIAEGDGKFRAALEQASKPIKEISATVVTWRLKALRDAPVKVGERIAVLRHGATSADRNSGATFKVEVLDGG